MPWLFPWCAMEAEWPAAIATYYRSPAVRARIAEYCGGRPEFPEWFSSYGLAAYGGRERRVEGDGAPTPCANTAFDQVLAEGADICRALADRQGTLLQFDVDYVSPTDPAAPYRQPALVFQQLEPVHDVLRETFADIRVSPRVLVTGRGYHYVVRALRGSPFHTALVELGSASPSTDRLARAHEGAGRLAEHIAHRVLHRIHGRTELPVRLADVPPPGNGPFICLDLSAYGDPVRTRYARCAFSANQKSGVQGAAPDRPFVFVVPREDRPLSELLRCREDAAEAAAWAESRVAIPDVAEANELVEDYRHGPVARFHALFDKGPLVPREAWPFTYDTLAPDSFPGCVALPLVHPNPLLLRPASLRTICLALLGLGFHPRSIAGLVRSKFEQDHGWTPPFSRYDPALRAMFYVRILCGALADGLDSADLFTCATQEASGLCDPGHCAAEARRLFGSIGARLRVAACS